MDEVTFEQDWKRRGPSHVDVWRKSIEAEGTASAKVLRRKNAWRVLRMLRPGGWSSESRYREETVETVVSMCVYMVYVCMCMCGVCACLHGVCMRVLCVVCMCA